MSPPPLADAAELPSVEDTGGRGGGQAFAAARFLI
jgi:hypothetical protein